MREDEGNGEEGNGHFGRDVGDEHVEKTCQVRAKVAIVNLPPWLESPRGPLHGCPSNTHNFYFYFKENLGLKGFSLVI